MTHLPVRVVDRRVPDVGFYVDAIGEMYRLNTKGVLFND